MHWIDAIPAAKGVLATVAIVARAILVIHTRQRGSSDERPARAAADADPRATSTRRATVVAFTAQVAGWLLAVLAWLHSAGVL